jgi:hypothetical protein
MVTYENCQLGIPEKRQGEGQILQRQKGEECWRHLRRKCSEQLC